MHATMSRALRLEYDDRDDPIVEIAAPTGEVSRDIMGDISGAQPASGEYKCAMTTTAESYVDTFGIAPDVYRRRWLILVILNLSLVTIVIAVSSLNVALPTIQRRRRVGHRAAVRSSMRTRAVFARISPTRGAVGRPVRTQGCAQAPGSFFGGAALVREPIE